MSAIEYQVVRVWPVAEWGAPRIHLVRVSEAVTGKTLCGQPARHAMQPTPLEDIAGLEPCPECETLREEA